MMMLGDVFSSRAMYRHIQRKFLMDGSLSSLVHDVTVFSETQICLARVFCWMRLLLSLALSHFPKVIFYPRMVEATLRFGHEQVYSDSRVWG